MTLTDIKKLSINERVDRLCEKGNLLIDLMFYFDIDFFPAKIILREAAKENYITGELGTGYSIKQMPQFKLYLQRAIEAIKKPD